MNLKNEIWDQLESNRALRLKLMADTGITEAGLNRSIKTKSTTLTKYAALKAISEFTSIPVDDLVTIENETTATP